MRCLTAVCKPFGGCCGGCGSEVYYNEWYNDPPRCCDPCDHCGNWSGCGCGGCGCGSCGCGGCGGGGCGCDGGYSSMGRPGTANMNYAMSPSSKRMIANGQRVNKQSMNNSSYAAKQTIPTPNHAGYAKQSPSYQSQGNGNMNYSGQYAQQSNQPNGYRMARKPQQQQQQNAQQMMYQQ
jgi:hypothetical protein